MLLPASSARVAAVAAAEGRDHVVAVGVGRIQNPDFEKAADADARPLVEGVEAHLVTEVLAVEDGGRTPAAPLLRAQGVGQPQDGVGAQRAEGVVGGAGIGFDGRRAAPRCRRSATTACHIGFKPGPLKSSKNRLVAPVENATSPSSSPLRPPKMSEPSTSSGHQVTIPSSQGK